MKNKNNNKGSSSQIKWYKKDSTQAILMIAPMLIGFFLFTYAPIVYILRYAFLNPTDLKKLLLD